VNVSWTITNTSASAVPGFEVGFYVNPGVAPVPGMPGDWAEFVPGLAPFESSIRLTTLTADLASFVYVLADSTGVVAESNESDNLAAWTPPGAVPALTGPLSISPLVVEESATVTVTAPVNPAARNLAVYLGGDQAAGFTTPVLLGVLSGNTVGEGVITGTLAVPLGSAGSWTIWIAVFDAMASSGTLYAYDSSASPSTYTMQDFMGTPLGDSGLPLVFLDVLPSSRPNLTGSIDSVTVAGPGLVDLRLTVTNDGAGDAPGFLVGLYVDPALPPGPGSSPGAWLSIAGIAAGGSHIQTIRIPGNAGDSIFAYADFEEAVPERSETDNLGYFLPPASVTATSSTPVPLADPGVVTSDLFVDGAPSPIRFMTVSLDISHTFDNDLVVSLTSPWGATIQLFGFLPTSGDDLTGTVLFDLASISISEGSPPFTGTFRPEQPLSTFAGMSPGGTWTLTIEDTYGMDTGTLNSWSLSFW